MSVKLDLSYASEANMSAIAAAGLATFLSGTAIGGTVATPLPAEPATPPETATPPATAPATPAEDPYFPTNALHALVPSPENSRITRANDEFGPCPYLFDDTGILFQMCVPGPGEDGTIVGGKRQLLGYGDPGHTKAVLLTRGGKVYALSQSYGWKFWNAEQGGWYNGSLPDAVVKDASGATPPPATASIDPPAPYKVQPGSSGRTLVATPGQIANVFAAAQDGDTITLTGKFAEPVPLLDKALKWVFAPGTVVDFTDQPLAQGKGGFVPTVDSIFWGPGKIIGAGIKESSAGGTAGIRAAASCIVTVGGGLVIERNQNGITGGGFPWVLNTDGLDLVDNGLGDDFTHEIYIFEGGHLHLKNTTAHTSTRGVHAVKSRGPVCTIENCELSATRGTVVDLANGTAAVATIVNTLLQKRAGDENHGVVGYAMEGAKTGNAGLVIMGGEINALCDNPLIQGIGGSTVQLLNVKQTGNKLTAAGATVTGIAA